MNSTRPKSQLVCETTQHYLKFIYRQASVVPDLSTTPYVLQSKRHTINSLPIFILHSLSFVYLSSFLCFLVYVCVCASLRLSPSLHLSFNPSTFSYALFQYLSKNKYTQYFGNYQSHAQHAPIYSLLQWVRVWILAKSLHSPPLRPLSRIGVRRKRNREIRHSPRKLGIQIIKVFWLAFL